MNEHFHFHVLGSGSRGNATVVTFSDAEGRNRHVMIDLGLGPRTSRARCAERNLDLDRVEAAILTHVDRDHCNSTWQRTLTRNRMPVHVAGSHLAAARRAGIPAENLRRIEANTEIASALAIRTVIAPHDRTGSLSLRLEHHARREGPRSLGWATDLGRFTPEVEELLRGCDAIGIESNYDHGLQVRSDRPPFLKDRIMGGNGHLSNEEAHAAVIRLAETATPSAIALLHLSRDCNHPDLLHELWTTRSPHLVDRLHITDQRTPSERIEVQAADDEHHAPASPPRPIGQTLWH